MDEINHYGVHHTVDFCEHSISTKPSVLRSSRAAPAAVRRPLPARKAGKIDALFKTRAGGYARRADLRHQLLSKIVTVAAKHVKHIKDAEVPRVLRQLKAGHSLEEALRITFAHDATPPAIVPATVGAIPVANQEALERAQGRATEAKVELLKRVDMLTGAQLAERLGLTRATVDKRRTEGKLLALEFGTKRGFRYPAWQSDLVQDAQARAMFEQVLCSLGEEGGWSRYRFFTQAAPTLGGVSPTEALRAGRREEVLHAAEIWAAGEQGGG